MKAQVTRVERATLGADDPDGAQVVLKARRQAAAARVRAASDLQQVLRRRGLPVPEVLVPPAVHSGVVVTVEAPLAAPEYEPPMPVLTAASAAGLATLVAALDGDLPLPVQDLAEEASALLETAWQARDRVLAHDDWEAQNLRFAPGAGVVAIYDGDSLAALPEPVAAGTAAAVQRRVRPRAGAGGSWHVRRRLQPVRAAVPGVSG